MQDLRFTLQSHSQDLYFISGPRTNRFKSSAFLLASNPCTYISGMPSATHAPTVVEGEQTTETPKGIELEISSICAPPSSHFTRRIPRLPPSTLPPCPITHTTPSTQQVAASCCRGLPLRLQGHLARKRSPPSVNAPLSLAKGAAPEGRTLHHGSYHASCPSYGGPTSPERESHA